MNPSWCPGRSDGCPLYGAGTRLAAFTMNPAYTEADQVLSFARKEGASLPTGLPDSSLDATSQPAMVYGEHVGNACKRLAYARAWSRGPELALSVVAFLLSPWGSLPTTTRRALLCAIYQNVAEWLTLTAHRSVLVLFAVPLPTVGQHCPTLCVVPW